MTHHRILITAAAGALSTLTIFATTATVIAAPNANADPYVCDATVRSTRAGVEAFPPDRSYDSNQWTWLPAGTTVTYIPETHSAHPNYPELEQVRLVDARWVQADALTDFRNCGYL